MLSWLVLHRQGTGIDVTMIQEVLLLCSGGRLWVLVGITSLEKLGAETV